MVDSLFGFASPFQIFAYQDTAQQISALQRNITTGRRVNSPLDGVNSFMASTSLNQRAADLSSRLDEIGKGFTILNKTKETLSSLSSLLSGLQNTVESGKNGFLNDRVDFGAIVLADNPVAYFRLNDVGGASAENLGSIGAAVNGTYFGGYTQGQGGLYIGLDNASTLFNGVDSGVSIPNDAGINSDPAGYTQRSIELVFSANSVSGRQVLYEEGGSSNALSLYVDKGSLHVELYNLGDDGPFNISTPVVAGRSYHVALTFDTTQGEFTAYMNGKEMGAAALSATFPTHSGGIGIGYKAGGTYYHDGASGGTGDYFNGRISDVAIYNTALNETEIQGRYDATLLGDVAELERDVRSKLNAIDPIVNAAYTLGTNLLKGNSLALNLQDGAESSLFAQGTDVRRDNLGFSDLDFRSTGGIDRAIREISSALETIETVQGQTLNRLDLLGIRSESIQSAITTAQEGSDALVAVDLDETEAHLAVLELRQLYQISTLGSSSSYNLLQSLQAPLLFGSSAESVLDVLSNLSYLSGEES